jgi:hypothetical protein
MEGSQARNASENDKARLKQSVESLGDDLCFILETMYEIIHKEKIKATIPVLHHASVESLVALHEHEGLSKSEFAREGKRAVGVE